MATKYRYKIQIKELFNSKWNGASTAGISNYTKFADNAGQDYFQVLLEEILSEDTVSFWGLGGEPVTSLFEKTATISTIFPTMFWKYFIPKAFEGYIFVKSTIDVSALAADAQCPALGNEIRDKLIQMIGDKRDLYVQRIVEYIAARNALFDTLPITKTDTRTITDATYTDLGFAKHSDTPTTSQNPSGNTYVSDRSDTSFTGAARTHTDALVADTRMDRINALESQIRGCFSEWADYIISHWIILADDDTLDENIESV